MGSFTLKQTPKKVRIRINNLLIDFNNVNTIALTLSLLKAIKEELVKFNAYLKRHLRCLVELKLMRLEQQKI